MSRVLTKQTTICGEVFKVVGEYDFYIDKKIYYIRSDVFSALSDLICTVNDLRKDIAREKDKLATLKLEIGDVQ